MVSILKRLDEVGFEKTRRGLAALSLSFFISIYLLLSLNAPPGWGPAFLALSACYVVAFLSLTAEWFWGRWFASGIGWSGMMVAILALVLNGWIWPLAIYGGLHALVVGALSGKKMAAQYDLQESWRRRYGMDEFGVARLRKTVTRAAASLPSLILWALGPKEGQGEGMLFAAAGIATLLTAAAGLRGLVRLRSWGWMMVAGAGAALWLLGASSGASALATLFPTTWYQQIGFVSSAANPAGVAVLLPAVLLTLAALPFARPALRFLRSR
jgi:hypothetical protein